VIPSTQALFDSSWRAAAYCLLPRVILLSLLPLVLMGALAFGLGYFYWEVAIDAVRDTFASWELLAAFSKWLEGAGLGGVKSMLGPLVVVFLATPVLVVLSLLAVAWVMTPTMVNLVAQRRFPGLEKRRGGSFLGSVTLGVVTSLLALAALVITVPLWLVPPLALIVPPLIWGWLTYRVMSYDVLAEYASREERRRLMRRHRPALIGMGLLCGYLGTAPSLVWALGAVSVIFAPVLVPIAIWIYTLVFAFSSLWFAHHALSALAALRLEQAAPVVTPPPVLPATQDIQGTQDTP
jgi:hypothetical protein